MKTTIIVMFAAILFCWSTVAQAQLNFGIKAGYNSSLTLGNFGSVTTGSYDLNSVKAEMGSRLWFELCSDQRFQHLAARQEVIKPFEERISD